MPQCEAKIVMGHGDSPFPRGKIAQSPQRAGHPCQPESHTDSLFPPVLAAVSKAQGGQFLRRFV